jgi:hypothetical protein
MAGLAAGNSLRLVPDPEPGLPPPADVQVEVDAGDDASEINEKGDVVRIDHADGSITVSLDGRPIEEADKEKKPVGWFDNLAEEISDEERSRITAELLRGIEDDLTSRKEWIEDRAQGIRLLGLKLELPNVQGASDGAPIEGMSRVRNPLLLEAVLRFQANARSELLPTDGPVKIRNDSTAGNVMEDQLATALEMDMNHYLTAIATEYYPDTDRMLFLIGFGGTGFKKVYKCPLRNRPVSESVDANDLIVNQSATDLANASRVTHRSMMKPSTVKRMQILGVYRGISLTQPNIPETDPLEDEERAQQGITVDTMRRPEDRDREIYETCCELDVRGFEHKIKGKETGLQIPYVVTIDKSSREMLSMTRNYGEKDDPLPVARKRFVKFPFVPGLGFYDIGLLHILGNTTNAVTAAWRELLDSGMYANFPGYLTADQGGRQNTNIFRIPPGGSASVKTNGLPIRDFAMPLPYSTSGMGPLMQLVENMVETGRRIGGTAEVQVGEGRADVPVGTIMAMIDQAIKVMNAVHKRMFTAQAEEFQLFKELFREDPESFFKRGCKSKTAWDKAKFLAALSNCDLVPQADPNTSSSGQRIMKVWAVKQMQQANPTLYDPIKVDTIALAAIGWSNPEEFFVPPQARANPPPQLIQMQETMANEKQAAAAKETEANARAAEAKAKTDEVQAKIVSGAYEPKKEGGVAPPGEPPLTLPDVADSHAKVLDAETRRGELKLKERMASVEDQNRDRDRDAKERDTALDLAKAVIAAPAAGESGKQVSVADVGDKTKGIIKDVDKGMGLKAPT